MVKLDTVRSKLFYFIKTYWAEASLLLFLLLFFIINFSKESQLLGWDNFSVSLNLNLNFWRSFTTWREYRAFGVANDSEIVDIFRMLLLALIRPFFSNEEYIYTLFEFCIGVFSVFLLVRKVISLSQIKIGKNLHNIISLLSALFYGFNLNALETFYFPIAIYTARFAYLPLLLYVFLSVISSKKNTLRQYCIFVVVSFLIATSYLTATVFITVVLLLSFLFISLFANKKYYLFLALFLLLQSFWLFPFANYTKEKAKIIPLASSFTEVNEALLNKPAQNFSFEKLLILFPETLNKNALPFKNLQTNQAVKVHPLVDFNNKTNLFFILPLFFVLAGFVYIIFLTFSSKRVTLIWPLTVFISILFLLRKTLPPLGNFYQFISANIPFFSIIFRFSGTKFYPFLLLAECLMIAFGIFGLYMIGKHLFNKTLSIVYFALVVFIVLVTIEFPFASSYWGNFVSQLVKLQIPPAYSKIAQTINADDQEGRVLHLPYDQFSYWKSYSWGYMGSSFLNFMLDKPLVDRTFEPASQELDSYNVSFLRIVQSSLPVSEKVNLASELFRKTGTKYIIFDETVGPEISARNVLAWGVFNTEKTEQLIIEMEQEKVLQKLETENVDGKTIALYEMPKVSKMFESPKQTLSVDEKIVNTFIDPLLQQGSTFIQYKTTNARTYPFWQPNKEVLFNKDSLTISQEFDHGEKLTSHIEDSSQKAVSVYIQKDDKNLNVIFQPQSTALADENSSNQVTTIQYPLEDFSDETTITTAKVLANWQGIIPETISPYRLVVNNTVLPLPIEKAETEKKFFIGSVITPDNFEVSLLKPEFEEKVAGDQLVLTQNPNCYNDKDSQYTYSLKDLEAGKQVTTQNGMTCLTAPLIVKNVEKNSKERLFSVTFSYAATTQVIDKTKLPAIQTAEKFLTATRRLVDETPTYNSISACILNPADGTCLNERQNLKTPQNTAVTIPSDRLLAKQNAQILFVIPGLKDQRTTAAIQNVEFQTFVLVTTQSVTLTESSPQIVAIAQKQGKLELSFPYFQGKDTLLHQPLLDGLQTYNGNCGNEGGYRSVVSYKTFPILSYLENCYQGIFYTLPYNPASMYLWTVDYTLQAGKQPRFHAFAADEVKNEYLSRYQQYPNFVGFKELQRVDSWPWLSNSYYDNQVQKILDKPTFYRANTTLAPFAASSQTQNMTYEINQGSEGSSILGITTMNVFALPGSWQNIYVDSGNPNLNFDTFTIGSYKKLYPSLWQVTGTVASKKEGKVLLEFGQAYDRQWELYKTSSVWDVLLGKGKVEAEHVKANGWSNGWIIADGDIDGETTYMVFYTPERLMIIGWIVTILTVIAGGLIVLRHKKTISKEPEQV